MTIIVFSDSHGSDYEMAEIIRRQKRYADCFLHLGDGAVTFLELCNELNVLGYAVKGNCDLFLKGHDIPTRRVLTLGGVSFFLTHGDAYAVGWSTDRLANAAKEAGCRVALYGHTHVAEERYLPPLDEADTPIHIFNPGSIARPRDGRPSYGKIDTDGVNLLFSTVRL